MNSNELASLIDHTLLKPDATEGEILKLCREAREFGFFSVCVAGVNVAAARRELGGSKVKVCSVVGFPTGAHLQLVKAYETSELIKAGAQEIDMVINIGALKENRENEVVEDIEAVVRAAGSALVKVIIETALLNDDEKVRACECAVRAGAQFVKTSTGFASSGAIASDVELMRKSVGKLFGVKASGGIKTLAQAKEMIEAGANRLGTSNSVAIIKEL